MDVITLEIYNCLAQKIATIVREWQFAVETHTLFWNGNGFDGRMMSSGVYYYVLKGRDLSDSKNMLFLKQSKILYNLNPPIKKTPALTGGPGRNLPEPGGSDFSCVSKPPMIFILLYSH